MTEILIILLTVSFINICVVTKCMTDLNKRIDELGTKISTLQYQTDDVLHDIDVVNRNVIQYCASLKRLEDEKIDAEQNLESLWQDAHEEPQNSSELIVYKYKDKYFWFTIKRDIHRFYGSWNKFVADEQLIQWAYVSDLFPKGGKK